MYNFLFMNSIQSLKYLINNAFNLLKKQNTNKLIIITIEFSIG